MRGFSSVFFLFPFFHLLHFIISKKFSHFFSFDHFFMFSFFSFILSFFFAFFSFFFHLFSVPSSLSGPLLKPRTHRNFLLFTCVETSHSDTCEYAGICTLCCWTGHVYSCVHCSQNVKACSRLHMEAMCTNTKHTHKHHLL